MNIYQFCEKYLGGKYTLDIRYKILVISYEVMPCLGFGLLKQVDEIQPIKSITFDIAFKQWEIKFH